MRRLHADEHGVALVTMLGLMLVMSVLVTGILTYGIQSMRQADQDQNWHAALGAAEAGVDDFLYRINRDNAYWQAADPDWDGSPGTPDPGNEALQDGGWASVPGGSADAEFHYEIDASAIQTEGNVTVVATGRVGEARRTIKSTLRRENFLDFMYFTEYETLDPTAYSSASARNWAADNCVRHRWDGRHSNCTDIFWFGSGSDRDVVDGPFHTNDTIAVSGTPEWTDEATTSDPAAMDGDPDPDWYDRTGSSSPDFPDGFPQYHTEYLMPPSNDQIRAQADPAINGDGCLYLGPTFIRLEGGQAYIKSAETADPNPIKCPIDGTMASLPSNGVIYVMSKPESSSCSPQPHPYDLSDDLPDSGADITQYDCRAGDVFVEGELDGRLTIASENNVIITNDLTYADDTSSSDDLLGLVANNFIEIFHPVHWERGRQLPNSSRPSDCDFTQRFSGRWYCMTWESMETHGGDPFEDPVIHAALLSVTHSIRVQNYAYGDPLGTIHLRGAMAQIFRGPVGTFSGSTHLSGFDKDYQYDWRLKYLSPPHFINPVKSAWGEAEWSEEPVPDGL